MAADLEKNSQAGKDYVTQAEDEQVAEHSA